MRWLLLLGVAACWRGAASPAAPTRVAVVVDRDRIQVDGRTVATLERGRLRVPATGEPVVDALAVALRAPCGALGVADVQIDGAVPYATLFALMYNLGHAGCATMTLRLPGLAWTVPHRAFVGDTPSTFVGLTRDQTDSEVARLATLAERGADATGILILPRANVPVRRVLEFAHATRPEQRRVYSLLGDDAIPPRPQDPDDSLAPAQSDAIDPNSPP